VLQQVLHEQRARIVAGRATEVRHVVDERRVERNRSACDLLHDAERDERLGHRRDTEQAVLGDPVGRSLAFHAETCREGELPVEHDRECSAGDVLFAHARLELAAHAIERVDLRRGGTGFFARHTRLCDGRLRALCRRTACGAQHRE